MKLLDATAVYVEASPELAGETEAKLRHRLNCWLRHSTADNTTQLTGEAFDAFRKSALAAGLAARTIEETVNDIRLISGVMEIGRRLKRWKSAACRHVPSLELMSAAYDNAEAAVWPNSPLTRSPELLAVSSATWLRAFIVFAYHTAFRLRDLRSITWDSITDEAIVWRSSKTSAPHRLPNCAVVQRHLKPLRKSGSDRVFPISAGQERLVRRELNRIAGVEPDEDAFGPQPIRRSAINQWTLASPEAGRIVHGSGLGVMAHYLDPLTVLTDAMSRRVWPSAMLTDEERDGRRTRERKILDITHRLPVDRLDDLIRVGHAFAS